MGKGQVLAYVRVSTVEQNEARQKVAIENRVEVDEWFFEKASAKDTNRPKLQELLKHMRNDDICYIESFSRLARSTKDLLSLIEQFEDKGVKLISLKENLDTSTPTGKLMVTMIGAINTFEREQLLERQREGIAIAKKNGKYKGRKPVDYDIDLFNELYDKWKTRQVTQKEMMEQLGMSRTTLHRRIKERDEELI